MNIFKKTITALATVGLLAMPLAAAVAETPVPTLYSEAEATAVPVLISAPAITHYTADTTLAVGSANMLIKAGSGYSSLEVKDGKLLVSVPESEAFEIRTSNPPSVLENSAGLATCNVLPTQQNQMIVSGPANVQVFAGVSNCSTSNASSNTTPKLSMEVPVVGEMMKNGDTKQVIWSVSGGSVASVRLRLSLDGGVTFPTVIFDNQISNGYYSWTVPLVTTTDKARFMIEGFEQGRIVAFAVSELFSIEGLAPTTNGGGLSIEPYDYEPATETLESSSVDIGVGYVAAGLPVGACTPGVRLKLADSPTVYYCGIDGKRHPFPNRLVHDSWFDDFNGVVELTAAEMAGVQLGANVTYRPGVRMVKLTTDPKVYAVAQGGILRWVETEAAATRLYGADWNQMIDDVPDTFFADYEVGESLQ